MLAGGLAMAQRSSVSALCLCPCLPPPSFSLQDLAAHDVLELDLADLAFGVAQRAIVCDVHEV